MRKQPYLNNLFIILFFLELLISKPYRGGELRTRQDYRYGRFEVRMQSAQGDGVVSSFFTYRDYWAEGLSGAQHWNEIDYEWLGNHDDKVQTNLIIQNQWDLPDLVDIDMNPHNDFHTYAFEWTPDYVAWFLDGEMIRWVDNFYTDSLYHFQQIMMNIWQPTAESWVGEFDPDILPVYAFYDWVKYYAYVPGSGNAGSDNNFIELWIDNFDYYDNSRWAKATHTWDGNNCDFIYNNVVFEYGYMILCLTTPQNTGYNGEPLESQIEIIPSKLSIGNPYPNPFNHNIRIPIDISDHQSISYYIFDINGNNVVEKRNYLASNSRNRGIAWDGKNKNGDFVSSGTYIIRIDGVDFSESRKILFLK
tara:strand:+ start:3779 stop:4864 length:1086 start_codon:yes stop_codon:yes gene_type:complete